MKKMDVTKIELSGCLLTIKGQTLTLSLEELRALKAEIEKVIPTQPQIIREPLYPFPAPAYPWTTPIWNEPVITYDTGSPVPKPGTMIFCVSGNSSSTK